MEELSLTQEYQKPFIKKSFRWYIFITFLLHCIHLSQTEGILNPTSDNIMKDLPISQIEFDCLNLSYYIGKFLGSILFIFIYHSINRKYILFFSSISHAIINIFFLLTNKIYLIMALRAFSGIGNIWPYLYIQIWINQYGIKKYKKLWKNCSLLCSSFGIASGYILYLFFENKWKYLFVYNGLFLSLCGFIYMFFPNIYFSSLLVAIKDNNNNDKINNIGSLFNIRITSEDNDDKYIFFQKNKNIFKNYFFMIFLFIKCTNIFIFSTLQFWLFQYFLTSLEYKYINNNKSLLIMIFSFMITFNTLFGILLGEKFSKKISLKDILIIKIFSCIFFTPIPHINKFIIFCILLSLYQILGNINIIFIDKIILESINKSERKNGKDVINIFNVLLGSALGPLMYGLIIDKWGEYNKNIGMIFLRNYLYLSLILAIIAMIFKNKFIKNLNYNEYSEEENDNDDIEMNDL